MPECQAQEYGTIWVRESVDAHVVTQVTLTHLDFYTSVASEISRVEDELAIRSREYSLPTWEWIILIITFEHTIYTISY